ncbi:MAG: peptide chain release factor N(5)-glutamine methyltransferase [Candidatus Symbiothrix sp.]|nr:peptide chain release factor N(5)-glutamine methyltransferase [Candidatus Symbiothrix sp.]
MQQTLQYIQEQLQGLYPATEIKSFSYWILEFVCQKDKHALLRDKDNQLSAKETGKVREIVEELKKYRPIQYIVGETEFYGLKFRVDENVLIPRPETEELVDLILNLSPLPCGKGLILDIGTGSGCIAIALAKHLPQASVYALDISEKALEVARKNAQLNNVNVEFIQQDILTNTPFSIFHFPFSILVSNPPYIIPSEKREMSSNVLNYEPHQALFVPEEKPLLFYDKIADIGLQHLAENGLLFFEVSAFFGKAVADMLRKKGYTSIELFKDISGKDRMIKAELTH